jgi:hypothetical protein
MAAWERADGRAGMFAHREDHFSPRQMPPQVRKNAKLAQKLGQLQPFIAVFPQECWLAGPTCVFWANLSPGGSPGQTPPPPLGLRGAACRGH